MVGLLSLDESIVTKLDEKTATAYLFGLKDNGDPDPSTNFAFQYFPDTIQDTKQVNWASREVPGGSLPIYQWISSGERSISFTAWFTTDMNLANLNNGGEELFSRLKDAGALRRNVDIRSAILILRQFMLPTYSGESEAGIQIAKAPQKLILGLPGTGIGMSGGQVGDIQENVSDQINCIMTQCDVTYEALFPNGSPRIASVSLAFSQIAQAAKSGSVIFPQRGITMESAVRGGAGTGLFGYPLEIQIIEKKVP